MIFPSGLASVEWNLSTRGIQSKKSRAILSTAAELVRKGNIIEEDDKGHRFPHRRTSVPPPLPYGSPARQDTGLGAWPRSGEGQGRAGQGGRTGQQSPSHAWPATSSPTQAHKERPGRRQQPPFLGFHRNTHTHTHMTVANHERGNDMARCAVCRLVGLGLGPRPPPYSACCAVTIHGGTDVFWADG